jgi:DNA-binding NtrC family response regulator
LLRVIQEKEITRIGSNDAVKVNTRIIATSNRDLEKSVQKGEFREDLYFRLNVVNIRLPALRERKQDILPLAKFFVAKFAEENAMPAKEISADGKKKLESYPWRGNIRELENTMHRAILMSSEDEIEPDAIHLQDSDFTKGSGSAAAPAQAPSPADVGSARESDKAEKEEGISSAHHIPENVGGVESLIGKTIADVERDMILNTLDHTLGNRTHAAKILGISIRTLRNKLNQYEGEGVKIPQAGG